MKNLSTRFHVAADTLPRSSKLNATTGCLTDSAMFPAGLSFMKQFALRAKSGRHVTLAVVFSIIDFEEAER